jgi:hypothetical protein
MTPTYFRETPEAEQQARARERVIGQARRGGDVFQHYTEDDLVWAFTGHEDQLAELPAIAEAAREANAKREQALAQRALLQRETENVLAEMNAERCAEAERIARERLGLEHSAPVSSS